MKRILILFVLLPSLAYAKPWGKLKFTGLYSRNAAHIPLYYDASADLSAPLCEHMADTVKLGAAPNVGSICESTCTRKLNPDWFLAYVAVKKGRPISAAAKTDFVTVPLDSDWDKIFFCGWNPENGLSAREIGQQGIADQGDLQMANLMCKKGTDKNIFFVVGAASMDQCRADCAKCAIPAPWKK